MSGAVSNCAQDGLIVDRMKLCIDCLHVCEGCEYYRTTGHGKTVIEKQHVDHEHLGLMVRLNTDKDSDYDAWQTERSESESESESENERKGEDEGLDVAVPEKSECENHQTPDIQDEEETREVQTKQNSEISPAENDTDELSKTTSPRSAELESTKPAESPLFAAEKPQKPTAPRGNAETETQTERQHEGSAALRARLEAKIASLEAEMVGTAKEAAIKSKDIKFKDAHRRRFSFPFDLCKTWADMHKLINRSEERRVGKECPV